jgi:hypothetical protein
MKAIWNGGFAVVAVAALLAGVFLGLSLSQPVRGQDEAKGAASWPRYTVVMMRGDGLTVTDNKTNALYFYSADPGSEDGADLKLRGTIDLNAVGKAALSPRPVKK